MALLDVGSSLPSNFPFLNHFYIMMNDRLHKSFKVPVILVSFVHRTPPANNLMISAGKFVPLDRTTTSISTFMTQGATQSSLRSQTNQDCPVPKPDRKYSQPKRGLIEGFLSKMASPKSATSNEEDRKFDVLSDKSDNFDKTIHQKFEQDVKGTTQENPDSTKKKFSFFERYMTNKKTYTPSSVADSNELYCIDRSASDEKALNVAGKDGEVWTEESSNSCDQTDEHCMKGINSDVLNSENSRDSVKVIGGVFLDEPSTSSGMRGSDGFPGLVESVYDLPSEKPDSPSHDDDSNFPVEVPAMMNLEENVDYVLCEKCNKRILVWDLPEHQDFHFALELQNESKKLLPLGGSASGNASNKTVKRKSSDGHGPSRPSKKLSLGISKPSQKLDRFFTKKN